ncbi:MAG: hypothetical protein QW057_00430 [Candidatus Bathyarchaeia archaeon]
MPERYREGDFVETRDGLIFDVKGLTHPPGRLVAYVRYIPDVSGDRVRLGRRYRKLYSLPNRESYLAENHPGYIFYDLVFNEQLQGPPVGDVAVHYDPRVKLRGLRKTGPFDEVHKASLELAATLKEAAGLSYRNMGISGSVLVDLHVPSSDLDLMVYGGRAAEAAYHALKEQVKPGAKLEPYDRDDLRRLYEFRSKDTAVSFEDFVRTERRKVMQGKFQGRDYFLRFVKDWGELREAYGDMIFQPLGLARIKARVADATEATLTPCVYKVSTIEVLEGPSSLSISEITSYRGRFCEQAWEGETVVAQGKAERVIPKRGEEYVRLLLGSSREHYMALAKD